jgi:integrase
MYNIADTATPPKTVKHEAEFFELEEVLAIRDALLQQPLKWQVITDLLIDTGARRSEILGLKWEDIDFKNNNIDIHNNLQYTPDRGIYLEESTKNYEDRVVTVSPEVMRI